MDKIFSFDIIRGEQIKGGLLMKGKFLAAITLAATLLLTGCGGGGDQPAQKTDGDKGKEVTLKIGATPVPHAEILAEIKSDLKEKGITLEVVEFNDYVQPNIALNDNKRAQRR